MPSKIEEETIKTVCQDRFLSIELINGKVYINVSEIFLGKDMLFVNHRDGYKHYYKHVKWTKFKDQIILESPRVVSQTGVIIPINKDASILKNTIGVFPIIKNKSSSDRFYIDITNLVLSNSVDWDSDFKETIVADLSYIYDVEQLENEVIIKTNHVIAEKSGKKTLSVDFSFFLLPKPMQPRLFDYRMGFFCEDLVSFINHTNESAVASITRWRLEKKYKNKTLSVPVKPITFMLAPDIPKKWRPYVKAGIMEWLQAFEAAGFKNALEVKEVSEKDQEKIRNSVNYSIIRWGTRRHVRGYEDGTGSTVSQIVDLRSGEILKSDIIITSSYQHLSDDYFIRCAPMDKRAQQYPFPDDLMGELIQFVVAHEAGHAFGIKDANYGEYAYSFEKMRDKKWLQTMGHTPSVMTYARHNYIVQPKDSIDPSLLIQKVGPTDIYNIKWAYTPFISHEEENLERIVRLQDSIPWFRYINKRYEIIGPGMTDEVVDNDDPIKTTEMGLKNMERVLKLLPIVNYDKKDYTVMERLYGKTMELWYEEMSQVMSLIAGYTVQYKSGSQQGKMYKPIPYDIQKDAMDFIFLHAFNPPTWLTHPEYLTNIKYSTFPDKLTELQLKLLLKLLLPQRMKRLEYMEKSEAFKGISELFLSKFQKELFKDLNQDTFFVDARKRELQSLYVDQLCKNIEQKRTNLLADKNFMTYTNYSKSLFLNQLIQLKDLVSGSMDKDMNEIYRGHLKLILRQMEKF
ncbi:zinc-dependent metalloprotease [Yeosuana marina]|uniref:zinc-dependent metalloprotease n=1 Tax=Yeosuana marina TaxID=1565536 RepID=UPI00142452C2|nr:zinc-dependent metalloprotease [Yeosuana marina]